MGWLKPVGAGRTQGPGQRTLENGVSYFRLEVRDLRLSHTAVLFLLQGGSPRQLFDGVLVLHRDAFVGKLAIADLPSLHKLPVVLPRIVLYNLAKKLDGLTEQQLEQQLLVAELGA